MNLLQMDMNLLKVLYVLLETSLRENGAKAGFVAFCGKSCANEIARCAKRSVVSTGREPPDCYAYAQALRDKLAPVFVSLNEELFGDKENGSRCFRGTSSRIERAAYARSRRERSSSSGGDRVPSFARRPGVMNC